jgi:hypothetical protein
MTNMAARLAKFEKANPGAAPPRRVIRLVAARDQGESDEDAIDRWCMENPGEPRPGDDDTIILRPIFSPNQDAP